MIANSSWQDDLDVDTVQDNLSMSRLEIYFAD